MSSRIRPHTLLARILLAVLAGAIVLSWPALWLESMASAQSWPEMAHLQYPVLVGAIIATLPGLAILGLAYKMLLLVEQKKVFSPRALQLISYARHICLAATVYYLAASILFNAISPLNHISLLALEILALALAAAGWVFFLVTGTIFQAATEAWVENELTV
ncbi:MAG: DUF2975 domain-containing protein [Winkia neuii]|uniref:DUF2975 domain-containing protein n=1 Tax=Winkia neuii TaxID=33007 RepID=UPI00241F3B2F|nr:DUF2975 domain-containing protein [Winkia neuii]MBS5948510.1 DUF2975 domain-containing protein [Winkia neuii]